jgi:hypothetical protein
MRLVLRRILSILAPVLFAAAAGQAGTLSGTVMNRTTGKPTANVDLTLLSPTQGMRDVGSAKSDAQGRFTVTNNAIGMAPVLVRATYHDVSFNTFVPPGRPDVDVDIYDISKDSKTISVATHIVIFQPQGDKLLGAEEYEVQNASQPAAAFFRTEGSFDFAIPENGVLGQVMTTSGAMGMPVNQASIDRGKGRYGIAYAFRPGQTNVRLSYQVPYSGASATLKLPATYPGVKMLVVAPPGVTVKGEGLNPAGQEQGMMVYTHDPLPAKGILSVSVSGQGSPAEAGAQEQGQGQEQAGAGAQEGNSRTGPEVIAAPSRLDDFKWYLFAGLAALFAMGAILLTRKQVVVANGPELENAPAPTGVAGKSGRAKNSASPAAAASSVTKAALTNSHGTSVSEAVEQQVSASLDSLKDQIFRLELRRQAGTISEEEYAREKAQVEKLLRELVKG